MHPTTGWLLCQKLVQRCPRVIVDMVFVVVVAVVIIVEIPLPPCQECIQPQVGCCVKNEVDVVLASLPSQIAPATTVSRGL